VELGVISDTHGLLREEALRNLAAVDLIIHAGDVGSPNILRRLSTIAPVHAVRGNIDTATWTARLPEQQSIEVENTNIFVIHRIADLDFDPAVRAYGIVIYGHSHKATIERRSGVLYLNPGSAGPRRFRLPVTLARVTLQGGEAQPRIITLDAASK
jgi:putative phosphoesterase